MRQPKLLISIFILLIIGLHAVPVLYPRERKTLWPILEWSMYKDSRPPGPIQASTRRVIAITTKGRKEEVTMHLAGLSPTVLGIRYFRPMWAGDSSAARQLIGQLNRGREDAFVELRLESETYTVTDTGLVERDNPVITYRLAPSESR